MGRIGRWAARVASLVFLGLGSAAAGDAADPMLMIGRLNQTAAGRAGVVAAFLEDARGPRRAECLAALANGLTRDNLLIRLGCLEILGRLGDADAAGIVLARLPLMDDVLARVRAVRTLPAFWFGRDERRRLAWLRHAETPGLLPPPGLLEAFRRSVPLRTDGSVDEDSDRLRRRILSALAGEIDPVAASIARRASEDARQAADRAVTAMTGSRLGGARERWAESWRARRDYADVNDPEGISDLRVAALETLGEIAAEPYEDVLTAMLAAADDPDPDVRKAAWLALERLARVAGLDLSAPSSEIAKPPETASSAKLPADAPAPGDPSDAAAPVDLFRAGTTSSQLDFPVGDGDMPEDALASRERDEAFGWPAVGASIVPNAPPAWPEGGYADRRRRHARALALAARPLAKAALDDADPLVLVAATGTLALLSGGIGDGAEVALAAAEGVLGRIGISGEARAMALEACGWIRSDGAVRLLSAALRSAPEARSLDGLPEGWAITGAALDALAYLASGDVADPTAALALETLRAAAADDRMVFGAPAGASVGRMAAARLSRLPAPGVRGVNP